MTLVDIPTIFYPDAEDKNSFYFTTHFYEVDGNGKVKYPSCEDCGIEDNDLEVTLTTSGEITASYRVGCYGGDYAEGPLELLKLINRLKKGRDLPKQVTKDVAVLVEYLKNRVRE